MRYRRARVAGGCYFFTVVTFRRCKLFADEYAVSVLRDAFRVVMVRRPFVMNALSCCRTICIAYGHYLRTTRILRGGGG